MAARRSFLSHGAEWITIALIGAVILLFWAPLWLRFAAGIPLGWLVLHMAMEALAGVRCPACVERALAPAPRTRLGWRYARCRSCGARWYRSVLGSWEAAEGPQHDGYFDPERFRDPWRGGPVVDEATAAEGTHGSLLQNKRSRQRPRRAPVCPELPPTGSTATEAAGTETSPAPERD
jgi:hypothetical protein